MSNVAEVQAPAIKKIDRNNKRPLGGALVAPFWLLRSAHDETIANIHPATLESSRKLAAAAGGVLGRVTVPILQNTKVVKRCAELVAFGPPCDMPNKETTGDANEAVESALHQEET